jgi:hypothetical protein
MKRKILALWAQAIVAGAIVYVGQRYQRKWLVITADT